MVAGHMHAGVIAAPGQAALQTLEPPEPGPGQARPIQEQLDRRVALHLRDRGLLRLWDGQRGHDVLPLAVDAQQGTGRDKGLDLRRRRQQAAHHRRGRQEVLEVVQDQQAPAVP